MVQGLQPIPFDHFTTMEGKELGILSCIYLLQKPLQGMVADFGCVFACNLLEV